MKGIFVELPAFERYRVHYLDDEGFRNLQNLLMEKPEAGPVIQDTGGLRKLRLPDGRRNKGKRGGLRIIYYRWLGGKQFWLFTLYDKDESSDLTKDQKKVLKGMLERELAERTNNET